MLGRLVRSVALRSAARRYASRLGPCLHRDYGAGEHYTAAQIRAAAKRCRLPLHHLAIGYAAFMAESAFEEAANLEGDYEALRRLFRRYAPANAAGAFEPAPESTYAQAGFPPPHHE